ncbi:MAG: carboxypeptidase regulatory-like domain-containing protein [Candidatus Eremiobacteraeota bacterium]|nr:carboxypeptidase regulatory-like domain-containing protein [Candidatus Eremiobacteraeota bacterium]
MNKRVFKAIGLTILVLSFFAAMLVAGCSSGGGGGGSSSDPTYTPTSSPTQTTTVTGQVTDNDGPVANARVELEYTSGSGKMIKDVIVVYTDENGDYTIPNVEVGQNVRISAYYPDGSWLGYYDVVVQEDQPPIDVSPTSTPTPTPTPSVTPNPTPTSTASPSPTPTPTATPSPSPSTTPTPGNGTLNLSSTPSGAKIFIDSVDTDTTTPNVFSLIPGSHTYKLTLSGYQDFQETITIVADQTVIRATTLVPTSSGEQVEGDVKDRDTGGLLEGVEIKFKQGETTVETIKTDDKGEFSVKLPAGLYRAELRLAGYRVTSYPITIETGIVNEFHWTIKNLGQQQTE